MESFIARMTSMSVTSQKARAAETRVSEPGSPARAQASAGRFQFLWLCALVLSFAYERPLAAITPYDRLNPRLFDVVFLVGLMLVPHLPKGSMAMPATYVRWKQLVFWFLACGILWSILAPPEYRQYPAFFAFQYVVGFTAVYIALHIPLSDRQKLALMRLAACGGVFVALYCIPEYLSGRTAMGSAEERQAVVARGAILGPFGSTYFHLAQYQVLSFCVACALASLARSAASRLLWGVVALFITWPLFFCGARTGIGLLMVSCVVLMITDSKLRKGLLVVGCVLAIVLLITGFDHVRNFVLSGLTTDRLQHLNEGRHSIQSRLLIFTEFDITGYIWSGLAVPLVGAGFYIAPVFVDGVPIYRVDYGIHNIYVFAFEQGGIVGFVLFMSFVVTAVAGLRVVLRSTNDVHRCLAAALLAFLCAELVVGWAGQIFWRGFGTVNFNNYLILLLMLALAPAAKPKETAEPAADGAADNNQSRRLRSARRSLINRRNDRSDRARTGSARLPNA